MFFTGILLNRAAAEAAAKQDCHQQYRRRSFYALHFLKSPSSLPAIPLNRSGEISSHPSYRSANGRLTYGRNIF